MAKDALTVEDILGADGLLAQTLDGFEFRSSQLEMARLIQEALERKAPAIVEAGTGTGKTFGYLVPIILSGKKAVISTGTKNLQEQVFHKDLPLLKKTARLNIDAMLMKGRKNYLCLHRYNQFFSQPTFLKKGMDDVRRKIEKWLQRTKFADRAELSWLADDNDLWDALSSTSDQCLGSDCMFLEDCFLSRLRSRAAKARIIIVNHYLFFADLKVKKGGFGEIIPRFQVAVFDEAHKIEEIATSYFGESLSTRQLEELVNDLEKGIKNESGIDKAQIKKHINTIKTQTLRLMTFFDERSDRGRIDHKTLKSISEGPSREIKKGLRYLKEKRGLRDSEDTTLQGLAIRAGELEQLLDEILIKRNGGWLNWYERRKRSLSLHASPLNISERLDEELYQKLQSVIFTSATLSTNKSFEYFRSRLGLPEGTLEGDHPSHFDFKAQTLLYIPKDMPGPNSSDFAPMAAKRIADILMRTKGRALALFTSYHNLNLVYQILEGRIPYTLFRQGEAPRSMLLDEFKEDVHSVLCATGSFWQGVDVPGESLSCLIIDKLPFESPGEPLVAARIDVIREKGGNPFLEYQVPAAIISLKQGLGRLIRKKTDRGILSVLDTRIMIKKYGRYFLESLPDIPVTHDLSDIGRFFE